MKIATIGTGLIVNEFLKVAASVEGIEVIAMYTRFLQNAQEIAERNQISLIYTDLAEMLKNEDIDVVYIASPNSLHYEQCKAVLMANKGAIVEKPFSTSHKQALELQELAKERGLFLFEAISLLHLPNYLEIKNQLEKIGPLRLVQMNLSHRSSRYDDLLAGKNPNIFSCEFAGGAMMDMNIYQLHFDYGLFNEPESMQYYANHHENGVDTSGVLILKYQDFICTCSSAKDSQSENYIYLQGEKGYIKVEKGANGCQSLLIHTKEQETTIQLQAATNRLYYEIVAMSKLFNENKLEECYVYLEKTCNVVRLLETIKTSEC